MAKLGILYPYEEIREMAEEIIRETGMEIAYQKVIHSADAVNEARKAVEAGAEVLIARGYQALQIKQYTNIPLVGMRIHTQEIGLLVKRAKKILNKEEVTIGVVAFQNMLVDMSCMEELFDVHLLVAYMERLEDAVERVEELAEKGAELFIGGASVQDAANMLGYPALVHYSSPESIREALREAKQISYAMESEKKSQAQFETVLDTTFNGIIRINTEGNILVLNKQLEGLLGRDTQEVVGLPVMQLFPHFDEAMIRDILDGSADSYTTSVSMAGQSWVMLMSPIRYQDSITGAILSLQRISSAIARESSIQRDMYLGGFVASREFRDLHTANARMKEQLKLAKSYALSERPVLIYAKEGTEYFPLGEAIHNAGARRNGPFVSLNLGALTGEEQMEAIFGNAQGEYDVAGRSRAAVVGAAHGTLFLKGIEHALPQVQRQLTRVLMPQNTVRTDAWPVVDPDIRLIATSRKNLRLLVEQGSFSEELFYLLQALVIEIPPLRKRPEDLEEQFLQYFKKFTKKYNKYLVLTKGAKEQIHALPWEGNLLQLESFCERLVLTADKRSVDEVQVRKLYETLYPEVGYADEQERLVIYQAPEAEELKRLLEKYHGNRSLIAKELSISTTTLWRRMKKYGLKKYGISEISEM